MKTVREEVIRGRLKTVTDPESSIEDVKDIVCTFFRSGHCPSCRGCEQADNTVYECADSYTANIEDRPQEKWSKDFEKIRVRQKTPISQAVEIGMNCNTCYMYDKCPKYQKDTLCAFDWGESAFDDQNSDTAINAMISLQMRRISRAEKFEQLDGGVPDQTLSGEIDRLTALLQAKQNLKTVRLKVSDTRTVEANGGTERTGGSILQEIFGKGPEQPALPAANEQKAIEAPQVNTQQIIEDITAEVVKEPARRTPPGRKQS